MSDPEAQYPFLTPTTLAIAWSALTGQRRSFRDDSRALLAQLHPPLRMSGALPSDIREHRWVILVNHCSRPGFGAWWIAIAISGICPDEVHWTMTSAWTYPDRLRSATITPLMKWAIGRLAATYGFTTMAPMPPRPWEVRTRAQSVRTILHLASSQDHFILGLAPEGGDAPGGLLSQPPPGVGRFIDLLADLGYRALPAGVFEQDASLVLRFGEPFELPRGPRALRRAHDRAMADICMRAIASCLPQQLRGVYTAREIAFD